MLYFNRNGVWFTIPIAKNAVYDRELLEKQIHTSLLGLQNLKDRSPGIDQMRFEKPGEYKIKSVFGRDDIVIIPSILKPLLKKPTEKQDNLIFPIPVINVYDGNYDHIAWDVSQNFFSVVSPYIARYNSKNSDNLNIVLPVQDGSDSHLFIIDELELVTDDDMLQGNDFDSDYDTDGYEPHEPVEWPDWWTCAFCGGAYSECSPTDTGIGGGLHYIYGVTPPDDFWEYGSFYGPWPDYIPKCSDDAMSAFWWNHYSICVPSGIIRTEIGVGSVIGANSWTSQQSIISINLYQWSTNRDYFYGRNSGTIIREISTGDSCHYYSWGNKMDPGNSLSFTSSLTNSTLSYASLIDGSIWTSGNRHIYLWYKEDYSGTYSNEESSNDMSNFITDGIDTAHYPPGINDTIPRIFSVTTDNGEDHEITRFISNSFDYNGYTNVYKYGDAPVYMFSLYVAVYNSETYEIEEQNVWYGFVYDGRMHKIKFPAYDFGEHLFETATYISPDETETLITFPDVYAGLIGNMEFIGGRFMSVTDSIIQSQGGA